MPDRQEVLGSAAGLGAAVAVEQGSDLGELQPVRARGYWEQVWLRFKRDKLAIGSAIFIFLLLIVAFAGAPIAQRIIGHGPNDIFAIGTGLDPATQLPWGPWKRVLSTPEGYPCTIGEPGCREHLFVLGTDSQLGRDEFLRLLYGAQVSLEVAVLSTLLVMLIGVIVGLMAGYFRGYVDTIVSRVTEITMAFPALLFIIALASTVGPRINDITLGVFGQGVLTLVIVFTLFGWFYPARIIRAQVLSLREKEFIEAARMVGSSDWRIMRSHILPHLVAPIIVYSSLIVAQYILAEAGLSFLGLGVKDPTASWGNLLSTAPQYYLAQPWLMVWPGLAVLLTTLAFNLLGDGLRDAFDPRSSH